MVQPRSRCMELLYPGPGDRAADLTSRLLDTSRPLPGGLPPRSTQRGGQGLAERILFSTECAYNSWGRGDGGLADMMTVHKIAGGDTARYAAYLAS